MLKEPLAVGKSAVGIEKGGAGFLSLPIFRYYVGDKSGRWQK
jgi:hypothetical protein